MKRSLLSLSIAAAFLAQLPVHATTTTTAANPGSAKPPVEVTVEEAPPAPTLSPRMQALMAAGKDLKDLFGPGNYKGDMIAFLDKLAQLEHSEATRAQLMQHFGVERFFTVQRVASPADKALYTVTSPAHRYMDPEGNTLDWTALNASIEFQNAGSRMLTNGAWQSFAAGGKGSSLKISDIKLSGDQTRTAYVDIWLGKASYRVGKIEVHSADGKGNLVMDELTAQTSVTERAKAMSVAVDTRIKAITVGGQQVENLRFAMRMSDIDMQAFEKLSLAMAGDNGKPDPMKNLDRIKPQLIAFGKTMAARGSTIDIEELSVGYQGHKASIVGRMSLARMKDADFANAEAFVRKLVARFEVKVPLAMVNAIAGAVTRQQATAKGQTLSDGAIAQTSQGITDAMVGKVVTAGYGRVDNDMLTSVIEFKAGKLTLNNKEVQLPKKGKAPAK